MLKYAKYFTANTKGDDRIDDPKDDDKIFAGPSTIVNAITEIAGTDKIINIAEQDAGITIKGTLSAASVAGEKVVVAINNKRYDATNTIGTTTWTVDIPKDDITSITSGNVTAALMNADGNTSATKIEAFTLDNTAPTAPTITTASIHNTGTVAITPTESGFAYLVKDGVTVTGITPTALQTLVDGNTVNKVALTGTTATSIATTNLISGSYRVYVADAVGNLSIASSNAVTIYTVALSYGTANFVESNANDGSVTGSMIITLVGDTFKGSNGVMSADNYTVKDVPAGLTMVITKKTDTTAEITFTGAATEHSNTSNLNGIAVSFKADAFTTTTSVSAILDSNKTDIAIDFIEAPVIVETDTGTSLLGKAINITDGDGYQGLSVYFSVADRAKSTFTITSTGSGETAVAYDTTTKAISYGGTKVGSLSAVTTPIFTDLIGLTANGSTLTKTSGNTVWNEGGSYSGTSIVADGFVSAQAGQTNKNLAFGLSSSNDAKIYNKNEIDYGIRFQCDKNINIIEKGNNINGTLGIYTDKDVFSIKRVGDTITYYKNDVKFYESEIKTTAPLFLETAFKNNGGSLTNITMSSDDGIGNMTLNFNNEATQAAVNAVTNAVTATYSDNIQQAVTLFTIDADGKQSNNIINGTSAADTLVGTSQADTIKGLDNDDTITGGAGNDTLIGGTGDDILIGDAGNDSLNGGAGSDILTGDAGNDSLNGGAGSDILMGGAGNDSLNGGAGSDILMGGAGNDSLNGGAGSDILMGGAGNGILNGGAGSDILTGGAGNDILNGGAGSDILTGSAGNDSLNGGAGNDILIGGAGDDSLNDGAGSDILMGGAGNDSLNGGAGDDTLTGGAGSDVLIGGTGSDVLIGDAGDDKITGGLGDDTFIYGNATGKSLGHDTITDWETGNNKLDLKYLIIGHDTFDIITKYGYLVIAGGNNNADTVITIATKVTASLENTVITLAGVAYSDGVIDSSDIIL